MKSSQCRTKKKYISSYNTFLVRLECKIEMIIIKLNNSLGIYIKALTVL